MQVCLLIHYAALIISTFRTVRIKDKPANKRIACGSWMILAGSQTHSLFSLQLLLFYVSIVD